MILAIDVGNTNIVLGCIEKGEIKEYNIFQYVTIDEYSRNKRYYQNCFDKCVFIDDKVVGFVSPTGNIYVNAKKSATLSMDGFIDTSDGTSGYIEDKNIYLDGDLVGFLDDEYNLHFSSTVSPSYKHIYSIY